MPSQGKYLVVWMTDEGAKQFLGLTGPQDQTREPRRWEAIGLRVTETDDASFGVWLTINQIEERSLGPEAEQIAVWKVVPETCLIRWDFILAMQSAGEEPKEIGFKSTPAKKRM